MRWVVAAPGPGFSVYDTYVGWVEALRGLGHTVHEFNLEERLAFYGSALKQVSEHQFERYLTPEQSYDLAINGLYAMLYKSWPDVLLVVSGFFVPPQLLDMAKRTRTRVVVLYTECPYEDERQLKMAPYADVNLVDDLTSLEAFQAVGRSLYMPKAYRPSLHKPGPPTPGLECDLAFVGTGYRSRVEFLEQMNLDGLDVLLAGNWKDLPESSPIYPFLAHAPEDCLDNAKTVEIYRSAKVGLNFYRREGQQPGAVEGWSMGPRELEMAAAGLFFLRDPRGEGDEVLDMLPTFDTPAEASDLLRWWLAHPNARIEAAAKARDAVADRTFTANATALLRLLDA